MQGFTSITTQVNEDGVEEYIVEVLVDGANFSYRDQTFSLCLKEDSALSIFGIDDKDLLNIIFDQVPVQSMSIETQAPVVTNFLGQKITIPPHLPSTANLSFCMDEDMRDRIETARMVKEMMDL